MFRVPKRLKLGPQILTRDIYVYKEFQMVAGEAISPVFKFLWGKMKPRRKLTPPRYEHMLYGNRGVYAWVNKLKPKHTVFSNSNTVWKLLIPKGTRVVVTLYNVTDSKTIFKIRAEQAVAIKEVWRRRRPLGILSRPYILR